MNIMNNEPKKDNLQAFIAEVKQNPSLRSDVNLAGRSVTAIEAKQLKQDLATELARVASRYGYTLHADDFYQNGDTSWLGQVME